jgi:ATP-dependent RNA helicase HelY
VTPYELDPFQVRAIESVRAGRSVLVSAPTGAGKTVVAEAAIDQALGEGRRAFYTTPIKALSNQKFADLSAQLGSDTVGLLTGDNTIRGDAPVVVMTTEVLRNMLYAPDHLSRLGDLGVVVLDEVHYLQDAYRGAVWEEVIIHLPLPVRLVCLSATVSNAEELGAWLETVRGPTDTIIETERPVELRPLYMVGDRSAERPHLIPILLDGEPNPEGSRFTEDPRALRRSGGRPRRRFRTPGRIEVIDLLEEEDMLPAIYFIFSRAACDDAVAACRDGGVRLTSPEERRQIRAIVDEATAVLADDELDALDADLWAFGLEMGVASHHAGLIPIFKETVERCFTRGLVKVVFATETLALGINMPARTVVIEKLTKFNGEAHEFLSPGEFTQLTGRAGRRGIDTEGDAVVLWSPFVSFEQVAALAASRSFPLRSSFRPTYNMAANLVRRYPRETALEVLGQSFGQFQADRSLVSIQRRLRELRSREAQLEAECGGEGGAAAEYLALQERVETEQRSRRGSRESIRRAASMLRPGDLVDLPEDGPTAVVISVAHRGADIRLRLVTPEGEVRTLRSGDLSTPLHPIGDLELPVPYEPTKRSFIEACAAQLSLLAGGAVRRSPPAVPPTEAEAALRAHPLHDAPDRARRCAALLELRNLRAEIVRLESATRRRSESLQRRFDAVLDAMSALGALHDWALTTSGRLLAALYHECDLAIALALQRGLLDELEPPDLAAVLATFTYEERRPDPPRPPAPPTRIAAARIEAIETLVAEIQGVERSRGVQLTRNLDRGFARLAAEWVRGRPLTETTETMAAGDFVRNVKLLIDLAGQIATVATHSGTRAAASSVVEQMARGVVTADLDLMGTPR